MIHPTVWTRENQNKYFAFYILQQFEQLVYFAIKNSTKKANKIRGIEFFSYRDSGTIQMSSAMDDKQRTMYQQARYNNGWLNTFQLELQTASYLRTWIPIRKAYGRTYSLPYTAVSRIEKKIMQRFGAGLVG